MLTGRYVPVTVDACDTYIILARGAASGSSPASPLPSSHAPLRSQSTVTPNICKDSAAKRKPSLPEMYSLTAMSSPTSAVAIDHWDDCPTEQSIADSPFRLSGPACPLLPKIVTWMASSVPALLVLHHNDVVMTARATPPARVTLASLAKSVCEGRISGSELSPSSQPLWAVSWLNIHPYSTALAYSIRTSFRFRPSVPGSNQCLGLSAACKFSMLAKAKQAGGLV
eukprot:COSAG02_NODE_7145_length_3158_cov_1.728016_4_plen_226_part_00